MGPDEAHHLLADMQGKLARDPYEALGLFGSPTAADIRQAFLQLTKQFHPARFGRMSSDIQRMANEVFLGLRAAHDKLATPSSRPGAKPGSPAIARTTTPPLATRTGAGSAPPVRSAQGSQGIRMSNIPDAVPTPIGAQPSQRTTVTGGTSPLAPTTGSQRTTAVGGTSPLAQSGNTQRTTMTGGASPLAQTGNTQRTTMTGGTSPLAPTSGSQRTTAIGGTSPLAPTTGSQRTTATGGTSPLVSRTATPAHGVAVPGASRPGMSSPTARSSTTPPASAGGTTTAAPPRPGAYGVRIAPATQPGVGTPPRPASPSAPPAGARAAGPAGGASASPPVSASAPELAPMVALIDHGQFAAAKIALETMISRDPGNVRLLALLVYARGREAQLARRMDEARVELQEALQIDPSLELARIALGELFTRRK